MLSDDDGGRPEDLVADRVALFHDGDDYPILRDVLNRRRRHSFVAGGIEPLSARVDADHPEGRELGEELIADELDTPRQVFDRVIASRSYRRDRPGPGGRDCAIEVVDDFEQLRQDGALAALDLARHIAAKPRLDLFEFLEGSPMVCAEGLQLRALLADLTLEILDIRWLARAAFAGGLVAVLARPPAPIDNTNLGLGLFRTIVSHALILSGHLVIWLSGH